VLILFKLYLHFQWRQTTWLVPHFCLPRMIQGALCATMQKLPRTFTKPKRKKGCTLCCNNLHAASRPALEVPFSHATHTQQLGHSSFTCYTTLEIKCTQYTWWECVGVSGARGGVRPTAGRLLLPIHIPLCSRHGTCMGNCDLAYKTIFCFLASFTVKWCDPPGLNNACAVRLSHVVKKH
jgi:hypothetical protein